MCIRDRFLDLAQRTPELRNIGIQEWLSFFFKSPQSAPGLYPEHDLFIPVSYTHLDVYKRQT